MNCKSSLCYFYLAKSIRSAAGPLMIIIFCSRRVHCWHYVGLHFRSKNYSYFIVMSVHFLSILQKCLLYSPGVHDYFLTTLAVSTLLYTTLQSPSPASPHLSSFYFVIIQTIRRRPSFPRGQGCSSRRRRWCH